MFKLSGDCVVSLGRHDFQAMLLDESYLYGKLIDTRRQTLIRVPQYQSEGFEELKGLPVEPVSHMVSITLPMDQWYQVLAGAIQQVTKVSELKELEETARRVSHGESPITFKYEAKQLEDFCRMVVERSAPYDQHAWKTLMLRIIADWNDYLTANDNSWVRLDPKTSQNVAEMSVFRGSKEQMFQAFKELGLEIKTTNANFFTHRREGMVNLTKVAVQLMSQLAQPQ